MITRAILLAAGAALALASGNAAARVVGYFQGTASLPPISITDEKCAGSTDAFRAVAHLVNRLDGSVRSLEACWYMSDMGGTLVAKDVVATCLRKNGEKRAPVTFQCQYIDKRYFRDPKYLPKQGMQ